MVRYRMCVHAMKGNDASRAKSNAASYLFMVYVCGIVTRAPREETTFFRVQLIGLKDGYLYGVDNEIKSTITVRELYAPYDCGQILVSKAYVLERTV